MPFAARNRSLGQATDPGFLDTLCYLKNTCGLFSKVYFSSFKEAVVWLRVFCLLNCRGFFETCKVSNIPKLKMERQLSTRKLLFTESHKKNTKKCGFIWNSRCCFGFFLLSWLWSHGNLRAPSLPNHPKKHKCSPENYNTYLKISFFWSRCIYFLLNWRPFFERGRIRIRFKVTLNDEK